MDRLETIIILQKIAIGQATVEDLNPKHIVFKIRKKGSGLYVNGKLSNDEKDMRQFIRALEKKEVVFRRVSSDDFEETSL